MAAATHSNLLVENVNRILQTFVPAHGRRDINLLHSSIGVKSHGRITFADNKSNRAQFIRVPPDASVTHVKELLSRLWNGERPSLVISITGGAKEYNMKPKLLRAFRRGLNKVARSTGAWIITGGMNTGIMKLVGDIVQMNLNRSRPINLIGIATWGCVSGREELEVNGANVHYAKSRSDQKGEAPLEPNHTTFILVDDGNEKKFGGEITFRAKLEQVISGGFSISNPPTNPNGQPTSLTATPSLRPENADPVPVVLIVVEGGPNTVRTVHEAVVQNNIPAVFLDGTGRCCDLFSKAYHLYRQHHEKLEFIDESSSNTDPTVVARRNEEIKNKIREELKDELRVISGAADTATPGSDRGPRRSTATTVTQKTRAVDKTDYFELVYECLSTRMDYLNVITLNSRNPIEPDIDLVILQALLKATASNDEIKTNIQRKHEQLRLALAWNRDDIAKLYIMPKSDDWDKINLNVLFTMALIDEQIKFVKLFLDHDFSLTRLFQDDDNKLLSLYNQGMTEPHRFKKSYNDSLRMIYKEIIQPLIGEFFEVDAALTPSDFPSESEVNAEMEERSCSCCMSSQYHPTSIRDRDGSMPSKGSSGYSSSHMDVDKELFLWSVKTNRRKFALLFWSRGKNKICAALIATLVYTKKFRKSYDDSDKQVADEFQNLAIQILDKFYQSNPSLCSKAIIRRIPAYGNATWLELAAAAGAEQFIAQKAVQDVLNNIWYGYIDQVEPMWKIVFSTIILWFSGFLRYHNELVKLNEETTFVDESYNRTHSYQTQTSDPKQGADRRVDAVDMRLLSDGTEADSKPVEFVDFGCQEKAKRYITQYFSHVLTFLRAPCVKYLYNLYFHVIFLSLFSYMILCDFFPLYDFPIDVCAPADDLRDHRDRTAENHNNPSDVNPMLTGTRSNGSKSVSYGFRARKQPSIIEYILIVWVFTLLCEEIRQLVAIEVQKTRNAIAAYFEIYWNKLDVLAILLFYVGIGLRFYPASECYCAARIVLAVDLTIWFLRSLDMFAAVKRLGPKLVMIGKMANDLKFFMLMLIVFILAFGISSYSLIYGVQKFSWHLPREIVNFAYWQMFGELNALDTFEHNYKPNGYATFILLLVYMAVVSILLINLLIAMFSYTFDQLQANTDRISKFQRYFLVCEYLSRPSFPPPFIIFSHLWRLTLYILSRCITSQCMQDRYNALTNRTKYKISLGEKKITRIEEIEEGFGEEVYYNHSKIERKLADEMDLDEERVQTPQDNMENKIRVLENRIQTMSNQQAHMCEYLECLMDGLKTMGGDSIRMPERRRFDPDEALTPLQVYDDPLLNTYLHPGYHSI